MKGNGIFTGRATRATVAALALIGVLTAGVAASAGTKAPLEATYVMTYVEKDGPLQIWTGIGHGSIVEVSTSQAAVKIMGKKAEGLFTITTANGDSLILAFNQTWDASTQAWLPGPFTVAGGTGRFANASGGGTIGVSANSDGTMTATLGGAIRF